MDSVQEYLKGVLPLCVSAGGKLVKHLGVDRVVNGKPSGMVLVTDFDSAEMIAEMFASESYAALIPVREKGFSEMNILSTRDM